MKINVESLLSKRQNEKIKLANRTSEIWALEVNRMWLTVFLLLVNMFSSFTQGFSLSVLIVTLVMILTYLSICLITKYSDFDPASFDGNGSDFFVIFSLKLIGSIATILFLCLFVDNLSNQNQAFLGYICAGASLIIPTCINGLDLLHSNALLNSEYTRLLTDNLTYRYNKSISSLGFIPIIRLVKKIKVIEEFSFIHNNSSIHTSYKQDKVWAVKAICKTMQTKGEKCPINKDVVSVYIQSLISSPKVNRNFIYNELKTLDETVAFYLENWSTTNSIYDETNEAKQIREKLNKSIYNQVRQLNDYILGLNGVSGLDKTAIEKTIKSNSHESRRIVGEDERDKKILDKAYKYL